ncbi:MAG: class I SAM-dependent methyltransferase [Candidatus Aureabacteria bacterium]|nr:class I SAM-dependent methyltransferase [Candidatus Auribacterota bacterium]
MGTGGHSFSFGRNWADFAKGSIDAGRVRIAGRHILEFLGVPDLRGKYFLDAGCGSGLSSLAAFDAGAARVVSFDIDPDSVKTTEMLRAARGAPASWTVLHGSILDETFVGGLDRADIVYSWGVLHHTGHMWAAIERAAGLMNARGVLYMALYTTTSSSGYWVMVKQKYNHVSPPRKRLMELRYLIRHTCLPLLLRGKSPLRFIRTYKDNRGMSYLTDMRDWLGGWPYEDAKIEEVVRFCRERLNLELVNLATGEANTEYLFSRRR